MLSSCNWHGSIQKAAMRMQNSLEVSVDDLETLLSELIRTQFADVRGSTAHLRLRLPEKLLTEIVTAAIASQKQNYPWLALVKSVQICGGVEVEVTAGV